jgi:hypothetical protein
MSDGPYIPTSPDDFIEKMAENGRAITLLYQYPLPAMIACACGESGFGTSLIYKTTGCPFNLQKPAEWKYPMCKTIPLNTVNKPGEKPKPAPFCSAADLGEAARLWCEWIAYWPNKKARGALEAVADDAVAFAKALHLVGFAASSKAATQKFGELITERDLLRYAA